MIEQLKALSKLSRESGSRPARLADRLNMAKPIACAYGPDALRMMVSQWQRCCRDVADVLHESDKVDRATFLAACGIQSSED